MCICVGKAYKSWRLLRPATHEHVTVGILADRLCKGSKNRKQMCDLQDKAAEHIGEDCTLCVQTEGEERKKYASLFVQSEGWVTYGIGNEGAE